MRGNTRTLIASSAVLALAACSDTATGPRSASTGNLYPASGRPALDISPLLYFSGTRTATFTLTAQGGTFNIGGLYTVNFPPNSVCSLSSSYAPDQWDSPCATLGPADSVALTASYAYTNSGLSITFSPAMRFNPSTQVTLSTGVYASMLRSSRSLWLANPGALRSLGIYYIDDFNVTPVVDAASDSSLITHINVTTGQVSRRVKHFSGYNIASGLACDPSTGDPTCVPAVNPIVEQ
jgi:hypothetical protein